MTLTGSRNPNWGGGRVTASNGYILVRVGKRHHLSDCRGYAYEHRIVAESIIGRRLRRGEQVHHINGNKKDNTPKNIEVLPSRFAHAVKHRKRNFNLRMPGQENPIVSCACGCGSRFSLFDTSGRPRRFLSTHGSRDGKRAAVLAMAADRGTVHAKLVAPLLESHGAAQVMLRKLFKCGELVRKGHGIYGPA